jgi:hypothetical protein
LLLPRLLCDEIPWAHLIALLADHAKISVGDLSRDNDIEAVAEQTLIKAP